MNAFSPMHTEIACFLFDLPQGRDPAPKASTARDLDLVCHHHVTLGEEAVHKAARAVHGRAGDRIVSN